MVRIASLLFIAALVAQQQPAAPTFRAGTDLVEVDVRVIGRDGRFVTDLKPEDFQLLEDGTLQKIQSVTLIQGTDFPRRDRPELLEPGPPEHQDRLQPREPSTWIFLFDTPHLTPGGLKRTRDAVSDFVDKKMHDGDVAGVIADGKMANNRMTSDRRELKKAIDGLKVTGTTHGTQMELKQEWPRFQDEYEAVRIAVDSDNETLQHVVQRACIDEPDQCKNVPPDMMVREKARRIVGDLQQATASTLTTLQALSNGLARVAGPKAIVFVSEGFLVEKMESEVRQVVGLANRAGAHVYAIDARGLNKGSNADIGSQKLAASTIGVTPAFDSQDDGPNALAVDTGGFVVRNENNFGRALDEIQADAGTYYVLAYAPSNTTFDGKYRSIGVKVGRADVKVRARSGYLAIAPARLLRAAPAAPAPVTPAPPPPPGGSREASPEPGTGVPPAAEPGAPAAPAPMAPPAPSAPATAAPRTARLAPTNEALATLGKSEASPGAAERGWSAYERGDVATAATELKLAAAAPDARPWIFYALGMAEFAQQQYRESALAFEHVRGAAPEFEPVYFQLADAYMLQHDEGTAIKVLRDAQRRWAEDPEIFNALGVIQFRRGALDASIESFEHATSIAPKDSLAYYNLARAHHERMLKSQRYDRAMEKWVGGDADRAKAAENYQKYIALGGPFAQQARESLAMLGWK